MTSQPLCNPAGLAVMVAPGSSTVEQDSDQDLCHLFCSECNPPKAGVPAACGAPRKSDGPWIPIGFVPFHLRCVVCWDLATAPCPGCGS